ncbi:hypothetical protein DYB37_000416 [Aphanomyces astaci]|uniref:Malonyl-CoA decarboxylase C-terminal domain-containing protein n=1 Tax=Aphanomyces astaci TaxID=112090 RepID=A0A3R7AZG4_APHAT|nr:hypothetical protein DYB35_000210 [Aphanomyces astaci]RHZ25574.1 hypothetical protein DYB37_000416 [Aphanomyces astaci]
MGVRGYEHCSVLSNVLLVDFVPRVIIKSIAASYKSLDFDSKQVFLLTLARDLHVDAPTLLFRQLLSQLDGGMLFLVHLRADLRQVLGKTSNSKDVVVLRALDQHLQSFLASWFSVGFLRLERVTYEQSPGALLEKIIRYEAVHPVGTIIELKRRLGRGRRCFAFFHPSVPDEPLVFVHVALVPRLADSMTYIKEATEQLADEREANAAIFYSISSTQPGLQVWLLRIPTLKRVLAIPDWHTTEHVAAVVKPILMRLGAHYLFREKKRGKALCPVANFHLRNGAIFERLNWLGDISPKGLKNSAGLMVNYKYELSQVEANNENYLLHNTIPIGEQPLSILVD